MNLIDFNNLTQPQIEHIIDKAIDVKRDTHKYRKTLQDMSLAMVFQKTSTRTRVSFEVAMTQLGGHALFIDWRTTNFTIADVYDESQYLSRNVDCIMARLRRNADLQVMANASRVPVINGCDEKYHPSQAIADLMTMKERKGRLKGLELVYVGIHNNVCNSLIEACTKTGVRIVTVAPIFNEPSRDEKMLKDAKETGLYESTLDVGLAIKEADFVYTDTWVDMEFFLDPKFAEQKRKRIELMKPYQLNSTLLKDSKAFVMHDMPIHRGYEISEEIIESPRSLIYTQSENRLYSAKAILLELLMEHSKSSSG